MHKGLELLDEDLNRREIRKGYLAEGKKNIIFLDIDGVIQPYGSQTRFAHDIDATIDYLCERYDPEVVKHGDKYDVVAAYYDWDEIAVGRLAYLCRHTGSYIVMSTGWRQWNDTERFHLFLSFYGLEDYLLDTCENIPDNEMSEIRNNHDYFVKDKPVAIKKWLDAHIGEVNKYLVIDDEDMTYEFGAHFLLTDDKISHDDLYLAYYRLLRLDHDYDFSDNVIIADTTKLCFDVKTISDRKVVFFRTFYDDKHRMNDLEAKIRQHRYLITLLRHHFGGSHLKQNERAALFVWIMEEEEPDDIRRRYMLHYYSERTGKPYNDDGLYLCVIPGIHERDKFVYKNNTNAIKTMAEEVWISLNSKQSERVSPDSEQ